MGKQGYHSIQIEVEGIAAAISESQGTPSRIQGQ